LENTYGKVEGDARKSENWVNQVLTEHATDSWPNGTSDDPNMMGVAVRLIPELPALLEKFPNCCVDSVRETPIPIIIGGERHDPVNSNNISRPKVIRKGHIKIVVGNGKKSEPPAASRNNATRDGKKESPQAKKPEVKSQCSSGFIKSPFGPKKGPKPGA
jgi:hypothetical protein